MMMMMMMMIIIIIIITTTYIPLVRTLLLLIEPNVNSGSSLSNIA